MTYFSMTINLSMTLLSKILKTLIIKIKIQKFSKDLANQELYFLQYFNSSIADRESNDTNQNVQHQRVVKFQNKIYH